MVQIVAHSVSLEYLKKKYFLISMEYKGNCKRIKCSSQYSYGD